GSNVAIWNHESEKADKVGLRIEDGKKIRFFKSNGKEIED
ncbi:50S ribosomal protein L24, partial [Pseudomonadales bacterium]|nr:50S ribosomal protein L24 [Pseudomonadales bacterium]